MSDMNSEKNRVVWVDVPVDDLDRAVGFYKAVLGVDVRKESFEQYSFAVFHHEDGNGGCLVPCGGDEASRKARSDEHGMLVYFNVDGRIRDAVARAEYHGGGVLQPIHAIGPYGCRAIITDSEGNRIALHSRTDA